MSDLLPCPFCGTTALIDRDVSHDDDGYYEISCTNCTGASDRFIGVHAADRTEAVDFWNTRAVPTKPDGDLVEVIQRAIMKYPYFTEREALAIAEAAFQAASPLVTSRDRGGE